MLYEVITAELLRIVGEYNVNPAIHGILVQLPLPKHISEGKVLFAIDPDKDVDGFHPVNVGKMMLGERCFLPCTPHGILELLQRSGTETSGAEVVVVGRSRITSYNVCYTKLLRNGRQPALLELRREADVRTGPNRPFSYNFV